MNSVISENFLVFEIDNYSFIFKRVSTLKYRACNDIELNEGDISNFIIKQTCDTSEDFFIENNHKDESLPVWYDYVKSSNNIRFPVLEDIEILALQAFWSKPRFKTVQVLPRL